MKIWRRRTNTGRVVYKTKAHYFTPKRLARIASGIINRNPIVGQPDDYYFGWNAAAKIATQAMKEIGWRWAAGEVGRRVLDLRNRHDAAAILALRDFIRGMTAALQVAQQFAYWVPYVGEVLDIGVPILSNVVNEATINMPMITKDPKTGQETIHW